MFLDARRMQKFLSWMKSESSSRCRAAVLDKPDPIEKKIFKQSCPEIPKRETYKGSLPNSFWEKWPKNEWDPEKHKGWVNHVEFQAVCNEAGLVDKEHVSFIAQYIRDGAKIGACGEARWPTVGPNDKSVAEWGFQVADELASWVKEGLLLGPFTPGGMPVSDYTISPLTVREKPNGKLRLILDLSFPHLDNVNLGDGIPMSVNSGIDKMRFKTSMTSTPLWLEAMRYAGVGGIMSKLDMKSAYKHFHIHKEDLHLQCFSFGGRIFIENKLVFGTTSSPALYNWPAKAIHEAARRIAGLSPKYSVQQLDDLCSIVPSNQDDLMKSFVDTYVALCDRCGFRLAELDPIDTEKAFVSLTQGVILGVEYNTRKWQWTLPMNKLKQILQDLHDVSENAVTTNGLALRLRGRVIHYGPLIPGSKWYKAPLNNLPVHPQKKTPKVHVTMEVQLCVQWWIREFNRLRIGPLPIVDLRGGAPLWALDVFPDAAGVPRYMNVNGTGAGAWLPNGYWARLTWPRISGWAPMFGQKLTMMEGVAALLGFITALKTYGRVPVRIWSDNQGLVDVFKSGHSSCLYAWSVGKAISDVASALAVNVQICKIRRVSTIGAKIADALAKGGDYQRRVANLGVEIDRRIGVPRGLANWVRDPAVTTSLGQSVLSELYNA